MIFQMTDWLIIDRLTDWFIDKQGWLISNHNDDFRSHLDIIFKWLQATPQSSVVVTQSIRKRQSPETSPPTNIRIPPLTATLGYSDKRFQGKVYVRNVQQNFTESQSMIQKLFICIASVKFLHRKLKFEWLLNFNPWKIKSWQ